jgi:hypothetical protein
MPRIDFHTHFLEASVMRDVLTITGANAAAMLAL